MVPFYFCFVRKGIREEEGNIFGKRLFEVTIGQKETKKGLGKNDTYRGVVIHFLIILVSNSNI